MMTDDEREAFSIKQVAARLGISRTAVYVAIRSKQLTARKLGRRTIILRRDFEAFVASRPALEWAPATLADPNPAIAVSI